MDTITNATKSESLNGDPAMLYSSAQAAQKVGLSPSAICEALQKGELHGTKNGRRWQIHEQELDRYIRDRGKDCICKTCLVHYRRSKRWDHDVCRECYKLRHIKASRPLTKDTLYLIAVYTHRGDSAQNIAIEMRRPVDEIAGLLKMMRENGEYDRHVELYEAYQQYGIVR